jgi:hypothetical protein
VFMVPPVGMMSDYPAPARARLSAHLPWRCRIATRARNIVVEAIPVSR